jgi:transcription elongation factor GreA
MARTEDKSIPMTAAGLEALRAELTELREKRPGMVDRVATARSDGDLKENFAYHDARQDLGMLDGRVQTIEGILANVMVIEETAPGGVVGLGSKVVVRDEFGETAYSLVGPAEADISRGMISHESPLGTALVGHGVGDTVSFTTPGGHRSAEIISLD